MVGCALAAALIGGASFWVVNGSATALAINDAEVITQIDARGIVAPLLTTALIAGSPAAIQAVSTPSVIGGVLSAPRRPGQDLDGRRQDRVLRRAAP